MLQLPKLRNSALLALVFLASASLAYASTTSGTIDSTYKYGWSNAGGFANFAPTNGGLTITDSAITGYAWAQNTGWINFDTAQSGVTNNGEGTLAGFAWSQGEGWLSFAGVTIDSFGKFHGTATGANSTLTFDCSHCDVRTDWRPISARAQGSNGGTGGNGSSLPGTSSISPSTTLPSTPGFPVSPNGSGTANSNTGSSTSTNTAPHSGTSGSTTTATHPATSTASATTSFFKHWLVPVGIFLLLILGFILFFIFSKNVGELCEPLKTMPPEQAPDGTPDAPQPPTNDVPNEAVKDTTPAPDTATPQPAPSEALPQATANGSEPPKPESAGTAQPSEPQTPPETSTAQIPANEPIDTSSPQTPAPSRAPQARSGRDLLAKARATIQQRKNKKLEKILTFLTTNHKITNDEVEKLLHVSDATATRYLSALEKEGKIKQTGTTGHAVFYTRM